MNPSPTYVPRGASPEHYRQHCRLAMADGRSPIDPQTLEQQLVYLEFFPTRRPRPGVWPELDAAIAARTLPDPIPTRDAARIVMSMLQDPATWGRAIIACIDAAKREAIQNG